MTRTTFLAQIKNQFFVTPIVALLGPRQCGKTTLAKQYAENLHRQKEAITFFDLEDTFDLMRLENPRLTLESLSGLIIIDEIQKRPDLFPILRVLIDKNRAKQRYLILGSASRELIKQSSETLAGRIGYIELTPFQTSETNQMERLWLRGGFPPSYLSVSQPKSRAWRKAYIKTFLEQDIPALGFNIPANQLRRFWTMIAHYHGQIFNASQLGRSLNLSHNTIKKYLDLLTGTFMIRTLKPWHENIKKRQVKSPKIYFRDSGIFHALMRITEKKELLSTPYLGASWEGFVLEEVIRAHMPEIDEHDCYFWSTQSGAELDLLIVSSNQKIGYEFKYQDAPKITKSMRIALEDLQLSKLTIIYPGTKSFQMDEKIFLTNIAELLQKPKKLI
ncbi:MAG: ATP-binding protein [Bacteroidota bacterium]